MQLQFENTYLSITSFPTVDIPDFTVVTGPNGAGKSHLLQALQNGSIRTDAAHPNSSTQEIRLFDWNTLVPQDVGGMTSEALRQERLSLEQQFSSLRQQYQAAEPLRHVARAHQLPQKCLDDPFWLSTVSYEQLTEIIGDPVAASAIMPEIQTAAQHCSDWILGNIDHNMHSTLKALSDRSKIPIIGFKPQQIASASISNWGRTDLFQQSFARLFVAYRDAELSNQIAEFRFEKQHSKNSFLTPEEFKTHFGPAPWDFVNETIQAAGLDFSINAPEQNDFAAYTPQLTKRSTGATIPFASLSSGEKVLMSFAFCVYYANDRRQLSVYPKLLLFDEIDAPLHPSMTRSLIETITKTLVSEFGIKVIATTHSPSTVALAPDSAIYTMKPGHPGLHVTSKSEALNMLTVGVPTISISYDGRRQVFVESPADAKTYDGLYKILKPKLASERSLEFIATGIRSISGQETNTGCDVVKRLVVELATAGNQSVFGLVDFDGRHTATDRIAVLGHGCRNGIENYLFDPLLLACLICRDCKSLCPSIGLSESAPYPVFLQSDPIDFQRNADAIGEIVFRSKPEKLFASTYTGGLVLHIDERWSTTDDHALEELVLHSFPAFNSVSKNQAGRLMQHIIATVLTDNPDFIPHDFHTTLQDLLDRPAHA